jgi:hypothetical protein
MGRCRRSEIYVFNGCAITAHFRQVPMRRVTQHQIADRRYAHPINLPVLGMALACWALVGLTVWIALYLAA